MHVNLWQIDMLRLCKRRPVKPTLIGLREGKAVLETGSPKLNQKNIITAP